MSYRTYVLRVELKEIKPVIWRRFIVPSDITLDRLHDILQIVMSWKDCHLHEFAIDGNRYTEEPESIEEDGIEESTFVLNNLVKLKNTIFEYNYDFGDSWDHIVTVVTVEKTSYKLNPNDISVMCLAGKRACPPEDVGGADGYENFCVTMADKSHEEYKEYLTWFGEVYDSEFLDINSINELLLKYLRWSRDRHIPYEFFF